MPNLHFVKEDQSVLRIDTGMNEVEWGYRLNTQRFQTYGGEVVQILSCYIDDLVVVGDVPTYAKAEEITDFFVSHLRSSTQGNEFKDEPITMIYEERGWEIMLRPKEVPGFRYGRDVVVPQWKLVAAVVEPNREITDFVYEQAMAKALKAKGIDMDVFAKLDDSIGYIAENPFSNPFPGQDFNQEGLDKALGELADYFHTLIPAYTSGDFPDLISDGSSPLFLKGGSGNPKRTDGNNTQPDKTTTAPNVP